MNVLIDTNILIPLEDTECTLPEKFAEFKILCHRLGHRLYIHPAQKRDIDRDRNESRKQIVHSRIAQYEVIESPPTLSEEQVQQYGWTQNKDNDVVDNLLLHSLFRGAIHFLISDDKGIHRKAKTVGIQESVFRIDHFLVYLKSQLEPETRVPFGLEKRLLHEFNVEQPFFDSLRNGYTGFNEWYLRSAREQREAWCITTGNEKDKLYAICIYKEENNVSITDDSPPLPGRILKLCTFKVGENVRGRKLGERLLYTAFHYAADNNYSWIYLTAFGDEHELLISLCEDYGFENIGSYGNDSVFLKSMMPTDNSDGLSSIDFAIKYYPHFIHNSSIRKFLVPIKPEYHNMLFADISDTANSLFADDPSMYKAPANTIKKVYICHSKIKKIETGDLVLFYRTYDRMSIQAIGVVERTLKANNLNEIIGIVSKRTVYSSDELNIILQKEALVILFRLQKYIPEIKYKKLEKLGLKGPFQSIREIPNDLFTELF